MMVYGMRRKATLFVIMLGGLGLASNGLAQGIIEADIHEDYASQVHVSGAIVAGAILGEPVPVNDPGQMLIPLPEQTRSFCISARTRDGQYWAEGIVAAPAMSGDIRLQRKGGWQHARALANYGAGDFAAAVRLSDACALDGDAPLLPVKFSAAPDAILNLAVNSQRALRVNATLIHADGEIEGECQKSEIGERSTAFNFWCRFDIGAVTKNQEVKVRISRRMRVGPQTDEITILMP